jgi:hypothetical protein
LSHLLSWLALAATPEPRPVDKSRVEPGWIALLFISVLAGAVTFLWFSMRRHLRRIDVTRHQSRRGGPPPSDPGGNDLTG